MRIIVEQLPAYFERMDWQFKQESPGVFRTVFEAQTGTYTVWVRVTEHWVYFSIVPFVKKHDGLPHGEHVERLVLTASHRAVLAKFGLDQDGDVVLSVELPGAGFVFSHFEDALHALVHFSDVFREAFDDAVRTDHSEVV